MTKRDVLECIGYIIGYIIICIMLIGILYSEQNIILFFAIILWAIILASVLAIGAIITTMLGWYSQGKQKHK